MSRRLAALVALPALALLAGGCGSLTAEGEPSTAVAEQARVGISLPLAVYIVDDERGELSSARTAGEVEAIVARANEIWGAAGIRFDAVRVERIEAPSGVLRSLVAGDVDGFVRSLGRSVPVPEASLLNAFYVSGIGGPNGIAPLGTRVVLIADRPSVDDERVSAHELGHRLGLHHVADDPDRLLFPGTNGRLLTAEEITVARYAAQGLLDQVRAP